MTDWEYEKEYSIDLNHHEQFADLLLTVSCQSKDCRRVLLTQKL